jgi:hypothetical protein
MFGRILAWLARLWAAINPRPALPEASPAVPERPYGRLDDNGVFWYALPGRPETAIDVFEADRRLRKHGDGDKWAEAFTVLETAAAAAGMAALSPGLAAQVAAQKRAAFDNLAALSRKVFDLPGVGPDGGGWPDAGAFLVFTDYVSQLAALGNEFLPLPKPPARPAESPSPQDGN